MAILNMIYGQGNPYQPFHLNGISDLAVDGGNAQATITWTDPGDLVVDGQTLATWESTKLVRKIGSAPTDSSDGTLVVEETVANTYSVTGYTDTGLTNGTTYYYGVFAVADNGTEIISNIESVTPDNKWRPGANTVLYLPLNGDVVDYSTYNRTFTVLGSTSAVGSPVFDTIASGKDVGDFIKTGPNDSNWFAYTTNVTDIPTSGNMTLSAWINCGTSSNSYEEIIAFRDYETGFTWMLMKSDADKLLFHGTAQEVTTFTPTVGTWYNIVVVIDSGMCYIYSNGTQIYSDSYTYGTGGSKICIGAYYNSTKSAYREEPYNGKLSDVIVENVAWSAQEIADYYDLTKGDYGIS